MLPLLGLSSFAHAIDLVLTNSLITLRNGRWFRQICGAAMGMRISVYFAKRTCTKFKDTNSFINNLTTWVHTFLRLNDAIIIILDNSPSTKDYPNIFETPTGKVKDSVFCKNISNENISYSIERQSLSQPFLDGLNLYKHRQDI